VDGIRVYWNGKGRMTNKYGHPIAVPEDVSGSFPSIPVEGILWADEPQFLESQLIQNDFPDWHRLKLSIFDAPKHYNILYKERYELIRQNISPSPNVNLMEYTICQVDELLKSISSGKSYIIRNPNAHYYDNNSFLVASV
jgi:hypothetical protein